jgi:hypothetical protein
MPKPKDFLEPDGWQREDTATILAAGQRDHARIFKSPSTNEGQFCYGFLRWRDELGPWRYRFCMRVWSEGNKPPGHNYFHQTGGHGYNQEELDPEA